MEKFGLPPHFIKVVKTLYNSAHSVVIINGIISQPFKITRGVRQGDPLSCLLFDLAIEPLSAMLRNSNLEGYQIPGLDQKIIATLFADDTTVYLSQEDSFHDLEQVLSTWCQASGAKFNINKTEIIPIGTKNHRDTVVQTRKLNPAHPPSQTTST